MAIASQVFGKAAEPPAIAKLSPPKIDGPVTGISGYRGCGRAGVSALALNKSQIVLDVIESRRIRMTEHVLSKLPDAGFIAEIFHLLVYRAVYHAFALVAH